MMNMEGTTTPRSVHHTQPMHDDGTSPSLPFVEVERHGRDAPGARDAGVRTVCTAPLSVTAFQWQLEPPHEVLVVVVKGTFALVEGERATIMDEPRPLCGGRSDDDDDTIVTYPSDFAPIKPRVDLLASGLVAPLDREGARVVDRAAMQVGTTRFEVKRAARGCFGPRSVAQRLAAIQGTYDADWLTSRWPYLPADFDMAFFQAASEAQQVAALVGDERYELAVSSRSGDRVIAGSLPAVTVRVFADGDGVSGSRAGLNEVSMKLDTCAFDVEAMVVEVTWRGHVSAGDVASLFVTQEPLSAPVSSRRIGDKYRVANMELHPVSTLDRAANDPPDDVSEPRVVEQRRAEALSYAVLFHPSAPFRPSAPMPAATTPRGAELVKRWVSQRIADGRDLRALDLRGADLAGFDLSGCDLSDALLSGANLSQARLSGANLTRAKLDRATLSGANLERARVEEADLSGAQLDGAMVCGAVLEGADLSGVMARGANMTGVQAGHALFVESSWTGALFQGATLTACDFSSAVLDAVRFDQAAMCDVRLYDAAGEGVCFDHANISGARGERAKLVRGSFDSTYAAGSSWPKATLSESNFKRAVLTGAVLTDALCNGCDLSRASLRQARMAGCDLSGATLRYANLLAADLEGARLVAADLRSASLYGAHLWRADLTDANLEGAVLAGTRLESLQ